MPSVSKKQRNFMAAVAHSPAFAKKVGVPQSVGKDFNTADKGKKFGSGGVARADISDKSKRGNDMATKKLFGGKETYKEELAEAKAIKSGKISPKQYAKGEEGEKAMKKGGVVKASPMGKVKTAAPSRDGVAAKGKTKGKQIVMKRGGKC